MNKLSQTMDRECYSYDISVEKIMSLSFFKKFLWHIVEPEINIFIRGINVGVIDKVCFYNKALSAGTIKEMYNNPN